VTAQRTTQRRRHDPQGPNLRDAGLPERLSPPGARIGLMGGSFNPAHEGHRHLSRLALDHLGLDELWWLVSPQNPLKPAAGMAPLPRRLAQARAFAKDSRLRVTDIERHMGTRYTLDTVRALKRLYPRARFVLVLGADNLAQLARWRGWTALFREVPIAVFDRPTYAPRALGGAAAEHFAGRRLEPRWGPTLADRRPPAWVFFHTALNPASSTALRAAQKAREGKARGEHLGETLEDMTSPTRARSTTRSPSRARPSKSKSRRSRSAS
jgi:nicotinate-nucleotide adenylyltransferase